MRYKRLLNNAQLEYLIKNAHLTNQKLGKEFNVTPQIIASYKYRLRKVGIDIPKQKFHSSNIAMDAKKIADQLNK